MAYDWDIITAQRQPDEAYYRLLGEMLHRRASPADLQRIREFLGTTQLGDEVWFSLGEGLFQTTRGRSVGYRMWSAWSRSVLSDFDETHQLDAWRRFQTESSDGLEVMSEASLQPEFLPEVETEDDERTQRTQPRFDPQTHRIAQDPFSAIALIPSGPHTIRFCGDVYERVDEFTLLRLLQSGVFFQLDVLFGVRWIPVADHPGFTSLIHRLREEAIAELATTERSRAEVTQPGNC